MSSDNKFIIRRIDKLDYDAGIIELLSQLTVISKDEITREKFNNYIETISKNNNHITIVIEENSNLKPIVGTATLLIEQKLIHNISFVGHIEDVVVDEKYRGQSLGKLMIDHLVNKAELLDCYKVILDCEEKNKSFYSKCGFKHKGVEMALYFGKN